MESMRRLGGSLSHKPIFHAALAGLISMPVVYCMELESRTHYAYTLSPFWIPFCGLGNGITYYLINRYRNRTES